MAYSLLADPTLAPTPFGAPAVPLPPMTSAPGISSLLQPRRAPAPRIMAATPGAAPGISSLTAGPAAPAPNRLAPTPGMQRAGKLASDGTPVAAGSFNALPYEARSQMLGQQYGINRSGARAMTDNLYYQPENLSVLQGTALDPATRSLPGRRQALDEAQFGAQQQDRELAQLSHLAQITALGDKMKREQAAIAAAHKALVGGTDPVEAYLGSGGSESATIGALRIRESKPTPVEGEVNYGGQPYVRDSTGNLHQIPERRAQYPRQVDAGGGVQFNEVAPGKFTDQRGRPVEWRSQDEEKPLTLNEFFASPSLGQLFKDDRGLPDYGRYRSAHAAQIKNLRTSAGAGPAADPSRPPDAPREPTLEEVQAALAQRRANRK